MAAYSLTFGNDILRDDGAVIPADAGNADYLVYLEWVSDGNAPDPYVTPPAPTVIGSGAFLDRFTGAEQLAVQQAALASPQIALGLTMGLSRGAVDLHGATLAGWLGALVSAGVLTPDRAAAIATP